MARCEECIHSRVCVIRGFPSAFENTHWEKEPCDHFKAADVAPRAEVFEAVDKFRNDLIDKFIDLCRGNDFNKLTLLKIGDTVDQIYDKQIKDILRDEDERR